MQDRQTSELTAPLQYGRSTALLARGTLNELC